ncbi:hypothetical protein Ae150APs1_4554c [Pseudonocardia sp. Ae150A_Ps1]|nr:hypothetical protein Ae150APs1_4554c [Pseudonocardia sp. Ae150A_Ps1]
MRDLTADSGRTPGAPPRSTTGERHWWERGFRTPPRGPETCS